MPQRTRQLTTPTAKINHIGISLTQMPAEVVDLLGQLASALEKAQVSA